MGLVFVVVPALGLGQPAMVLTWPDWLYYAAVYGASAILLRLLTRQVEASLHRAEQLQSQQAERGNALDQSLSLERKRAQELKLLADSAHQLTGLNDPEAVMDEAARRLVDDFHFDHAAVFLVEENQLVAHAARGALSAARPLGSRLPLDEGALGRVARTGETVWQSTADGDQALGALTRVPITSAVWVPLRLAKNVVGVLEVASTTPAAMEAADVRSIESLADLMAVGLQASQLFRQLRSRQQFTDGLRRSGAAINESLDLAQIVNTVCLETRPAFEADQVELWLLAGGAPAQLQRAGAAPADAADSAVDLDRRGAILAGQMEPGRARLLVAAPAETADGRLDWLAPARSLILAPLSREHGVLGLLVIAEWRRPQAYDSEATTAAELLASHLAAAITNARLAADDRRRADELALLSDVTSAALELGDYPALLDTLANRLGELLEADGCYLVLWNSARQSAQLATVSSGLKVESAPLDAGRAAGIDQLTQAVLMAGQAVAVPDADLAEGGAAAGLAAAALSLPLIADGQWLGAAHLIYRQPRRFGEDEIAYAARAGRQIALAMSKERALTAERRRNSELQALQAASLRVTSSLDLRQVLEAILQQALILAGGEDAHIFLYDGRRLEFGAALWADGGQHDPLPAPRRGGLTQTVALTAQRVVVEDANRHPLYQDWPWGGAIVGLPLRSGGQVRGVMNVAFARPRQFDDNDLRVLDLLADQAAVALENARLFKAEREQRALAEALRAASLALSGSLEFEDVLDRLLDQIERVVPFDAAAILLVQAAGSQVGVARSRGYDLLGAQAAAWPANAAFDLGLTAPLRQMADTQQPLIVADTQAEPGWSLGAAPQLHAWAGVPIVAHQQVIAFFTLDKTEPDFYQQDHADRLAAFAGQAALALQNARLFEAERRRAAQLTLLSEVSQQVTGTLDESLLLQRVVAAMINRLGFAQAAILLPVDHDALQVAALANTIRTAVAIGLRQRLGAGVIGRAAELGATYLTNDIGRDPYYFDPDGRSTGSALALPMRYGAERLGILYLEASQPGAFSTADVVAYETLANHIATALQNARLYADARGRLREMTAVQSVSQTIVSSLKLDDIFETVVRLLHDQFGYAYSSIYELRGDQLRLKARVGYAAELIQHELPSDSGLPGRAIRDRQTQFLADAQAHPEFGPAPRATQSEICVPLLSDREVFGTLNVASEPGHTLNESDVRLLTTLAGQVTIAIQNARLYEAEREQRELAEALRQASLALSASLDYDTVLDRLLEQLARIVPYDAANIMLVDGTQATVARLRGYEQFGPEAPAQTVRLVFDVPATPNLARMLHSGQPEIVSDTSADPEWVRLPSTVHIGSWAGAPITGPGGVVALFSLDKTAAGFYQPVHATRLAAFVGQAALALENSRLFAVQRRRTEEQRLLLLAARDFSAALSERAVRQAIVRHMTHALEAANCIILAWDRGRDTVITLDDYLRPPGSADEAHTQALSDYPATRWVLLTRQALSVDVDDPAADPAERKFLEQSGQARLLMAPLYTGDDVFGLVEIQRGPGSQPFREADQQLALSLAAQAAVALENARLHTAVQENVRELDALLKANEALLSTLELDPLLHNILAAAVAAVPSAEMGTIILSDPASGLLRVRATYGYSDPRMQSIAFAHDQGYSAKAMRENRPLLINDAKDAPQLALADEIEELRLVSSAIVAPLVPKGVLAAPHGVISLDATRPAAFSDADLRTLVAFANTAVVAIDNAQLHAEVQRLAVTDSLTGLANPRAFEHMLATEAYRAARYGHSLSVIIMDIDGFKKYNDTFGHLAGNDRLKAIAGILRAAVRDPDLPVRYGGEEFAMLLPHTNKAGALVLAERIRELAQAAAPSPGESGTPVSGYTISLGVATLPTDALSATQLLLAADNAELAAKRAGKNRVCAAEPLVNG